MIKVLLKVNKSTKDFLAFRGFIYWQLILKYSQHQDRYDHR